MKHLPDVIAELKRARDRLDKSIAAYEKMHAAGYQLANPARWRKFWAAVAGRLAGRRP